MHPASRAGEATGPPTEASAGRRAEASQPGHQPWLRGSVQPAVVRMARRDAGRTRIRAIRTLCSAIQGSTTSVPKASGTWKSGLAVRGGLHARYSREGVTPSIL